MRNSARLVNLGLLVFVQVLCIDVVAAPTAAPVASPMRTVENLDLPRYMGTWYEIARFPNRFQRNCAGFTKADYRAQPDGSVEVTNQCREVDGRIDVAVGQARQIGGTGAATLEVRFAPAWLSFLPMVWGDYWIIDLDPAYSLAAVSEPERQYLWILSRNAKPDASAYRALLERLRRNGLDTDRLVLTRQQ
ncbi:MAG: lipocalin family protein [Pseudomonadota bacterium]